MSTVYLVRHGRTALNAAGVLRGRLDEPLDEVGRTEASALSALFASLDLTEIVSSPLVRATDTARAIAAAHGIDITIDALFIDRDYGPWAGKPVRLVEDRYGSVDAAPPDQIEDTQAFEERVITAFRAVVERTADSTALIVAHDAVNRALIRRCRGRAPEIPQSTGCWNRILIDKNGAVCDVAGALPGDGRKP